MSVKNNRVDIKFFLFPNLTIAWDTPSIFRKMRGWKPIDLSWTKWARERKEERELDKRMARAQAEQMRKAREARAEADRIDRLWFAANGLEIVAHIDDWQFVIPVREFLRGPKWDRPVIPAGTLKGWGVTKNGVWQFYKKEPYCVTMAGDTMGFSFDMGVYGRSRNLGMESFEAGVVYYTHGMQYQTEVYPEPYTGDARRRVDTGTMNAVYQHYEAKAREKNDAETPDDSTETGGNDAETPA